MGEREVAPGMIEACGPYKGAGTSEMAALQAHADGVQLCALGHHAWMPWLAITVPETSIVTYYVTFCVRCRHHEQYDL